MLRCPDCQAPLDSAYQSCPNCESKAAAPPPNETETSPQSQPVPLVAPYGEPDPRRARSRKKFLTIAAVIALVLLAREGGLLNVYLCGYTAISKTQTLLHGNQRTESGDTITYSVVTKNLQSTFTTKGKQYGFDSKMFSGWQFAGDLQDEIQNGLRKDPMIVASLEAVDLSGAYWLPLFKSGNCKYRVRLQVIGKDATVYAGVLEGETDFNVWGLCPVRTLKQLLGAEIAQKIVESLDFVRK